MVALPDLDNLTYMMMVVLVLVATLVVSYLISLMMTLLFLVPTAFRAVYLVSNLAYTLMVALFDLDILTYKLMVVYYTTLNNLLYMIVVLVTSPTLCFSLLLLPSPSPLRRRLLVARRSSRMAMGTTSSCDTGTAVMCSRRFCS